MAQPNVPQFGKWDSDGAIPYTQYFENARKGKIGGKMINPNDPEGNPEDFGGAVSPVAVLPSKIETDLGDSKPKDELSSNSREHNKKVARISGGYDNSIDRSPSHPHYQALTGSKIGISSPYKSSLDGSRTPGRSAMRNQGFDTPERASTVPKFGEWDESNPSSADGYSQIFNKMREEKQTGSTKATMITNDSIYNRGENGGNNASGCSCFGWFGKK